MGLKQTMLTYRWDYSLNDFAQMAKNKLHRARERKIKTVLYLIWFIGIIYLIEWLCDHLWSLLTYGQCFVILKPPKHRWCQTEIKFIRHCKPSLNDKFQVKRRFCCLFISGILRGDPSTTGGSVASTHVEQLWSWLSRSGEFFQVAQGLSKNIFLFIFFLV